MDNRENTNCWNGFAASVPGFSHLRYGVPCQDASSVILNEYPSVIVCDGRGSAKLSHYGANEAVAAFKRQISILSPFLSNILDNPNATEEMWDKFCKIIYRTLVQAKLDLAQIHNCDEKEFDFTVAFAIVGKEYVGCFQVGDGSLVVLENNEPTTVFMPDKGEFANQTSFLRLGGENKNKYQIKLFKAESIQGISATSDGPEHLMFNLTNMVPGKIFNILFEDLTNGQLQHQDIMDYLTRKEWYNDPRGGDDRSIAIIGRIKESNSLQSETPINSSDDSTEEVIEKSNVKPQVNDEVDDKVDVEVDNNTSNEPQDTCDNTQNQEVDSTPSQEQKEESQACAQQENNLSKENIPVESNEKLSTSILEKSCNLIIIASICTLGYLAWNNVQEIKELKSRNTWQKVEIFKLQNRTNSIAKKCDNIETHLNSVISCNCEALQYHAIETN